MRPEDPYLSAVTCECDSCNRTFPLSAVRFGRGGKASCPNCMAAREEPPSDPLDGLTPIEHAKQLCACGHVRHGHNQVGGACNQCKCKTFTAREDTERPELQAIMDFLDSWRYCPVSSSDNASRQCLEKAAKELLTEIRKKTLI